MSLYSLTRREQEVALLLLNGATNLSLGRDLSITPRTVKTYIGNIASKLGIEPNEYCTRVRIVYILCHKWGYLPRWPVP